MWKYYIELFTDDYYGYFVESTETPDGIPCCNDISVAKNFDNINDLFIWVNRNTNLKNGSFGIKGIYWEEKQSINKSLCKYSVDGKCTNENVSADNCNATYLQIEACTPYQRSVALTGESWNTEE